MGKMTRFVLIAFGVLALLVILIAVIAPLLINGEALRTRIESTLTKSLGRKVTVGKVNVSIWSGGLVAENATVADDPQFSAEPFIQADSVKIRVEMLPLLLHREVHIVGFALQSPKIHLLRAANGTWNYSTIGGAAAKPAAQDEETKRTFPNLTVGHVQVENGRITVGIKPELASVASTPNRVYDQVNLDVTNFGFATSFPFTASAHLPADGTVAVNGTAGPVNQQDASATPFSGHLEIKHLDPLAAGFVDASAGVSGLIEDFVLDVAWSGQQMHVQKLLVDSPHLTVVRSSTPKQPKPRAANAEGTAMLDDLSVDDAEIRNGAVTLTTAGQSGAPAVYQQINAKVTNITPKSWSPFNASAQLPGGGSLNANGKAGPFNQDSNASTPVDATISLKHVELETSGVLAPDAGISGMADLQAQVRSNGQTLNATGTAHVDGIKLAKNGRPSAKPVEVQFAVAQDERAMTGNIQHAVISIGRAVINLAGTYQSSGPTTAINMKVNGQALPIDELEAFLPALGIQLPQGSRLQGGTVTTSLTVSGSTASPVLSGPVRLDNTQLAGFDLGSKLQTLSRLTGGRIGSATGSGTNIRYLSMDVQEAGGALRTDKIAAEVAGLGTATGAGSISAAKALNYNVLLKLTGLTAGGAAPAQSAPAASGTAGTVAGLASGLSGLLGGAGGGAGKNLSAISGLAGGALKSGIPVAIGGTTSNPTFTPDVRGLALGLGTSAAQGFINNKTGGNKSNGNTPAGNVVGDPLKNALGGLLGKHK